MPHVTFIHGIGNKPAPAEILRDWCGSLADHDLDLDAHGVSSSFVYWADFLYAAPVVAEIAYESAADVEDGSVPDIGMRWAIEAAGSEAEFIAGLAEKIGFHEFATDEPMPSAGAEDLAATGFERVPLPGWLKRRLMKILLRDVHHYLFNVEFQPRPAETFRIRDAIRERTVQVLAEGAATTGPHVVVSHSMGTVIAYDCLKNVPECPPVDSLLTIGSPLGLDEVQDGLAPGWSRSDGFPEERLSGNWINVFDRLDPVCGFDPELANDFLRGGRKVVHDIDEPNSGRWRHAISKYFGGKDLQRELRRSLDLGDAY